MPEKQRSPLPRRGSPSGKCASRWRTDVGPPVKIVARDRPWPIEHAEDRDRILKVGNCPTAGNVAVV